MNKEKPYFKFVSKRKHPKYITCWAYKFGTIYEIRYYPIAQKYYKTIEGIGQSFDTFQEAHDTYKAVGY